MDTILPFAGLVWLIFLLVGVIITLIRRLR
jgi:hypothetical protein